MKFRSKMSPKWENIHRIQDKLSKKLKRRDKGFIDLVKMISGELLENSVKYYMKHKKSSPILFEYENKGYTKISIINQWILEGDLEKLRKRIDEINCDPDPYGLFLTRLQEILENRVKGENNLGLLRIISEGGFNLSYEVNDSKFSIYAIKNVSNEVFGMQPLKHDDLKIDVKEFKGHIKVAWSGCCRVFEADSFLDTYLTKLTQFAFGKKLFILLHYIEYMNSSSIPPLLTLIKNLEENKTESIIVYNEKEDWQRASFKPLKVITNKFEYVMIKSASNLIIE